MQFRQSGNRVQVLAYRGYDKEKRRATVKLLGSFDRHGFGMSDGLMDALNDDEKAELQSHIKSIRQSHDEDYRQSVTKNVDSFISKASDCLSNGECDGLLTPEYASRVYASIDSLTKVLRKRGFKRPPKVAPHNETVT
jgi:hypothetical protein